LRIGWRAASKRVRCRINTAGFRRLPPCPWAASSSPAGAAKNGREGTLIYTEVKSVTVGVDLTKPGMSSIEFDYVHHRRRIRGMRAGQTA